MPGLNTIPLQRFHGLNPTLPGYGGPRRSENVSFAALQQALMASLVSIVVLKRDAGSLFLADMYCADLVSCSFSLHQAAHCPAQALVCPSDFS